MPKYFFHFSKPDGAAVQDTDGLELQDNTAARREALKSLRDLIEDSLSDDLKSIHVKVDIVREDGHIVDRLTGQLTMNQQLSSTGAAPP